ncbi:MAG: hypothetical protein OXU45_00695 [Candidatus Melainabacteria bacterium]|nr:hypothetical protein [Candidatus Melainabacteria bacterium]
MPKQNSSPSTREDLSGFHKESVDTSWQNPNSQVHYERAADDWSEKTSPGPVAARVELREPIQPFQTKVRSRVEEQIKTSPNKLSLDKHELDTAIAQVERFQRNNPNSKIGFKTDHIQPPAADLVTDLVTQLRDSIKSIQYSQDDLEARESFVEAFNQFFSKVIELSLEVSNKVLKQTLELDDSITDFNIAEAMTENREISKAICARALELLNEDGPKALTAELPGAVIPTKTGDIDFIDYLKLELADEIKTLSLGAQFGIQSKELVECFKEQTQEINMESDKTCHQSCQTLLEVQKAIQGSVLQTRGQVELQNPEIGELDSKLTSRGLDLLLDSIFAEYQLRHDDIRDEHQEDEFTGLHATKLELAQLLTGLSKIQRNVQEEVQINKAKPIWGSTSLEGGSINTLAKYEELHRTDEMLGITNEETILGRTFPGRQIVKTLEFDDADANNMRENFERLIFEVSLVALIDAISTYRGVKPANELYMLHPNFETIPWLKDFYQNKIDEYNSMFESTQVTTMEMRSLAKELAKLGTELYSISSSSHPLFELADLCSERRYDITNAANLMLKRVAKMTDIGKLALHLELASSLFANLEPGQDHRLDADEVKRIKDLIEFLEEETKLIDENGEQVIAPLEDSQGRNEIGMAKFKEIQELIGSRGYLMLNTPLIIKFLTNSLESDSLKPQIGDGQSIENRNSILASVLFYTLVKFLPENSDDIDSLRARAQVYKTLLFINSKGKRYVPILFDKMKKQALGLQEDLQTPHRDDREGVFMSLSKDLENKLLNYPEQAGSISLRSMLDLYVDLDSFSQEHQEAVQEAEAILAQTKGFKGPLLKGIKSIIAAVLETDTATVVEFVKDQNNQELSDFTYRLLINKAGNKARELIKDNVRKDKDGDENLVVFDQSETSLKALVDILIYCKQAAFLRDKYQLKAVHMRANTNDDQFNKDIASLERLMNYPTILTTDPSKKNIEEFPGQARIKTLLTELLSEKEFGFRPRIGNHFDWQDLNNLEDKIEEAKETEYVFTTFDPKSGTRQDLGRRSKANVKNLSTTA